MKRILAISLAVFAASCTTDIPENRTRSSIGEKQDGIIVTVDTTTTEYEFDIKL